MFGHSKAYYLASFAGLIVWVVLCHFTNLNNWQALIALLLCMCQQQVGAVLEREKIDKQQQSIEQEKL